MSDFTVKSRIIEKTIVIHKLDIHIFANLNIKSPYDDQELYVHWPSQNGHLAKFTVPLKYSRLAENFTLFSSDSFDVFH